MHSFGRFQAAPPAAPLTLGTSRIVPVTVFLSDPAVRILYDQLGLLVLGQLTRARYSIGFAVVQ